MAWPVWVVQLVVAVAVSAISYLLAPKPKGPGPAKDLENPTADASRPRPVLFGTKTIKGLNLLWFGDKKKRSYKVKA